MKIRKAIPADVEGICQVCSAGQRDTYTELRTPEETERIIAGFYNPERILGEVLNPVDWNGWWVALEKGSVVGAGGGGFLPPGSSELYVLYLEPSRRGEGIGTKLLQAITEELYEQGAREQWVAVTPDNQKGIPFYQARGFVRQGERTYEGSDFVAWLFRRDLK